MRDRSALDRVWRELLATGSEPGTAAPSRRPMPDRLVPSARYPDGGGYRECAAGSL